MDKILRVGLNQSVSSASEACSTFGVSSLSFVSNFRSCRKSVSLAITAVEQAGFRQIEHSERLSEY